MTIEELTKVINSEVDIRERKEINAYHIFIFLYKGHSGDLPAELLGRKVLNVYARDCNLLEVTV